jgi:hypothetical protein
MLYCVDAPPPQLGPSVHTQAVTRDVWDGLMGSIAMVDGPKRSASIRSAFGSKTTSVDALDVFAADSQQDLDPADCSFDAALRRSTSADGLGPVEQIAVFVYPARSRKVRSHSLWPCYDLIASQYPTEEDIAALQQRAEECESAYFKLLQVRGSLLDVSTRVILLTDRIPPRRRPRAPHLRRVGVSRHRPGRRQRGRRGRCGPTAPQLAAATAVPDQERRRER